MEVNEEKLGDVVENHGIAVEIDHSLDVFGQDLRRHKAEICVDSQMSAYEEPPQRGWLNQVYCRI